MENRPVPLLVERAVAGGEMLARLDGTPGQVVFVRGAIPGERVRARIVRRAKGVAWAEIVAVDEPSPDRRVWPGDPSCGGGHYAHIAPARQLALKADIIADAFRRIAKSPLAAPPVVRSSPERGYRLRARLHVRDRDVGFFREQTHTLCDAAPSGQLLDATIGVARAVVAGLGARADDCEALVVAEDIAGRQRVVHLEPRAGASLADVDGASLTVEGMSGVTTAAGRDRVTLAGLPTIVDTASDLFGDDPPIDPTTSWTRHATSFFQGNRFLAGALVRRVLEAADAADVVDAADAAGGTIVDLYAGVGLFAVALAARGARVTAVEGDGSSGADLVLNAIPYGDLLRVAVSPVEHALATSPPPDLDVTVIDPPRTGLTPAAVQGLLRWRPRRIVYVSCDPPTLARDARVLMSGGYRLGDIDAFDLFPNTPHVETIAVFDR